MGEMNVPTYDRYETLDFVEKHHYYKDTVRITESDKNEGTRIILVNVISSGIVREDKYGLSGERI